MSLFPGLAELPATEKLFHRDPYQMQAEATVVAVDGNRVVLDRTVFYAESGGQVADAGTIEGIPVLDVQKQGGGAPVRISRPGMSDLYVTPDTVLVHTLERTERVTPGMSVSLSVDADHRLAAMRNHTAAHFVYHAAGVMLSREGEAGLFTKGCRIDAEGFRFDFANAIPAEWLDTIAGIANDLIAEGLPVTMEPEPRADDVFYWHYGDIVIPCGGTHVKSAREIGPVEVRRRSKGKGTVRLFGEIMLT